MHPVQLCDRIVFSKAAEGIELTCNLTGLPLDSGNLVYRAAEAVRRAAGVEEGVKIHLEKSIPLAAGLGGGSGNAAVTLRAVNELFGGVLPEQKLLGLAAELGSDVPFFLQLRPAMATGRGEQVESLEAFEALKGAWFLLIHPGFGVSTAWAYRNLARFPKSLNGEAGRARRLVAALRAGRLDDVGVEFYNSLEAPVLEKYPVLALLQGFLREHGAPIVLMSGSGSTTFAILPDRGAADGLETGVKEEFGPFWTAVVPVG